VKFRILSSALFLALIVLNGPASAGQTMTLAQCLQAGMKHNPSLNASRLSLDAAGQDTKASRADFMPSVSSSYSVTGLASIRSKGLTDADYLDQEIKTYNIKLTQILYAGSRIVDAHEKFKIMEQALKAELDLKKLELIYNIEVTFYKLMKAKQDVISATESVSRLAESVKSAEAFFRKELVPYVNVLQAQVDLADAEEQLGIAKNNVNRERVALFSLMDQPLDPDVEFSGGLNPVLTDPPVFETSLAYAFKNRPDIMSLLYQRSVAEKEADISMGKYLPVVRFDAGYSDQDRDYENEGVASTGLYDRDQRNRYWTAGVSATWEMFDGGRSWYEKEKHLTQAKRMDALIQDARNMISTGIRKALYSLSEARLRIKSAADAEIAANEYYTGEEMRLRAGISTIPSLLDAQGRLIRAQGNKNRAMLDYQVAASELKLFSGNLSDSKDK